MHDSSFGWRFVNPKMKSLYGTHAMGETAENLVEMYGISREDQDLFAYNSQMKASAANAKDDDPSNKRRNLESTQRTSVRRK